MNLHPPTGSRPLDVICRTFNCAGTLPAVLGAIARSEGVNPRYLFVDNGSTDSTRERFPEPAVMIEYTLPGFNYAMAINIAVPFLAAEYVLVISSHVVIENPSALRKAVEVMDAHPGLGGVCFSSHDHGEIRPSFVTKTSFNGLNGLWNSCSLYRSSLLRERPFNPEVYSAEDQEWSKWLIQSRGMELAHLSGTAMQNLNPRQMSLDKRVKEWECVAWFVDSRYLSFAFIKRRFYKVIYELYRRQPSRAWFWFLVGLALIKVRIFGAHGRSSYK
jgi:glycosyltransferase involved in cell wall biosynthesis